MKGLPYSMRRSPKTNVGVPIQKMVINFKNQTFTVADGSAAPGIGTLVFGDVPAGKLVILASRMRNLIFSTASANAIAAWTGSWAVGSAPNADANLTTASDFDINGPSSGTTLAAATAKVSPTQDVSSFKGAILDNANGSLELNLNVMVDDASQSGAIIMLASGIFELSYIVL